MQDHVTLRLPYYTKVCEKLFYIYQNVPHMQMLTLEGRILIKLCLGWLFELPNFPEGLYFNYCANKSEIKNDLFCSMSSAVCQKFYSLDEMRIVDQNVVYLCCPYLKEIKKVLISNSCSNDGVTVRHITPLTAVQSPMKAAKKRLEVRQRSIQGLLFC